MTKSQTRLAIFDCDGTLVDSQANICMAMEHAFEGAGHMPPLRHDIRRVVGLSLVESMRMLLPDADDQTHHDLAEHYRAAFLSLRNNGLVDEPLYDGMAALLSELDEDGWLLGVATGKSDRGLIRCLDHHAIKGLFVTLQTADRHPSKPHPSMVFRHWPMLARTRAMRWSLVIRCTTSIWAVRPERGPWASIGAITALRSCAKQGQTISPKAWTI